MIKRKKNIKTAKGTILLVTATKAEAAYFSQMRKDCRYMNLTVEYAGKDEDLTLKELIDITSKKKNLRKYDNVWCLFGFDEVGTDKNEVKEYEDYAKRKRINLCWFDPCFELWFLLHAASLPSYVGDASAIREKVKSLIGGEFSQEFLLTKGINLHLQLFSKHAMADINARKYNDAISFAHGIDATTMPLFDEMILDVCGTADMSHNQKAFK